MISLNPDAERLMLAMAEFEGWEGPSEDNSKKGSLTYRHHNPGALRSSPFESDNVDGFSVFSNDSLGWLAFHWDLMQKAKGNTVTDLGPDSTVADLIYAWAPPKDNNDTVRYINFVIEKSGLKQNRKLKTLFGK